MSLVEALLNVMMDEPGQIVRLADLGNGLGVTRQTVSRYLSLLEQSFLLRKLHILSRDRRQVERKLKKYYPTLLSPGLLFGQDDHGRSRVPEWLVVNQVLSEFSWRDPAGREVALVPVHVFLLRGNGGSRAVSWDRST